MGWLFGHRMKDGAGKKPMVTLKKKVLIIDDDKLVSQKIEHLMCGAGWDAEEVLHAEDVVMMAEHTLPDLIILDTAARGFDGYAIFKTLRDSPKTGRIPIIALIDPDHDDGVKYTPDDFEAAFDVRAPEGVIDKPVDPRFLMTCVNGVAG